MLTLTAHSGQIAQIRAWCREFARCATVREYRRKNGGTLIYYRGSIAPAGICWKFDPQ